jgi:hypothetical protein
VAASFRDSVIGSARARCSDEGGQHKIAVAEISSSEDDGGPPLGRDGFNLEGGDEGGLEKAGGGLGRGAVGLDDPHMDSHLSGMEVEFADEGDVQASLDGGVACSPGSSLAVSQQPGVSAAGVDSRVPLASVEEERASQPEGRRDGGTEGGERAARPAARRAEGMHGDEDVEDRTSRGLFCASWKRYCWKFDAPGSFGFDDGREQPGC